MKIKFDNEDELKDLAYIITQSRLEVCPGVLELVEKRGACTDKARACLECWENALRSVSVGSVVREMLNESRKER